MSRTLQQILNAGGSDPAMFSAAAQIAGLGDMLTPQHRYYPTIAPGATFKLSDLDTSAPGVRVGGTALTIVSGVNSLGVAVGAPSSVVPNGTTGLSLGSGNGVIRIVAKDGFTIRYMQFSGAGTATSTPTYFRANQTLKVLSSGSGKVIEVWTQLGTNASAQANSLASAVKAAILADANAMRGIASIDFGAGDGTSAAADDIPLTSAFSPLPQVAIAPGMTSPQSAALGTFLVSQDGNLLAFYAPPVALRLQYTACPRTPLEEVYPGSL
jgi:hypothetical protein